MADEMALQHAHHMALADQAFHGIECRPCLMADALHQPSKRCPIGQRLVDAADAAHHAWFGARFTQEVTAP